MLTIWQRQALLAPEHKGGISCIIAPRRSGKTYLIKEALRSNKNLVFVPMRLGSKYIIDIIQKDMREPLFCPLLLQDKANMLQDIEEFACRQGSLPETIYLEEPSYLTDGFFVDFLSIKDSFPSCVFVFIGTASLDPQNGFNQFLFKIHKEEIDGVITKWPESPFISQEAHLKEVVGEHGYKVEFEAKVPVIDYI